MKCSDAQLNILLCQANELSPKLKMLLDEHLLECEACREYSESLSVIMSTAQNVLSVGGASATVLAGISAVSGKSNVVSFRRFGIKFLAYAAALTLVVGGWMLLPVKQELGAVHDLNAIMVIMYENDDESMVHDDFDSQDLVEQLIILEGFEMDVDDMSDFDWFSSEEELPSTGLQSHNGSVFLPRICV